MPALDNVKLHHVETFEEACALKEWASRQPYLAVDTEGTGYRPDTAVTRMVQFGNPDEGWAVSIEMRGWGALCEEILTQHKGLLVAHNAKFDAAMIRKDLGFSFPLHRTHDTMIMHHTLNPHYRSGLKAVADRLIDPSASAGDDALKADFKAYGWTWATVPTTHPTYWCVPTDTQILTRTGWKKHDEIQEGDETLGYNSGRLTWTSIRSVQAFDDAPLVRFGNKFWSTECTPNHRWIMRKGVSQSVKILPLSDGWKNHGNTSLVLSGHAVGGDSPLTVGQASVLAWLLSDGHIHWQRPLTQTSPTATIVQSSKKFSAIIKELLIAEGAYVSERYIASSGCTSFYVSAPYVQKIWNTSGLRTNTVSDLVLTLSCDARRAWFQVWIMAEGDQGKNVITQNKGDKLDALALCAYLEGYTPLVRSKTDKCGYIRYSSREPTPQKTKITPIGNGPVWCPVTTLGTWTARDRNGNIFVTGNTYAALDTVLTARIYELLFPQIQAEAPRAYDLEMATAWLTEKVERRGPCLDREYAATNLKAFQDQAEEIKADIRIQHRVEPGSADAIVYYLQSAGYQFTKRTAGGAISLDKEVLSSIKHPLAAKILQYRGLQKLASTYLENFLAGTSDEHPYLHPSINSLGFSESSGSGYGVKTSRMSMSEPNLQNLPKVNKKYKDHPAQIIRNCIVARPGHTLLFCDFSQIEMRLLAHYSRDPHLINAFTQGDFFVNLARQIFQDPSLALDDPRRNQTKTIGYAEIYGAGLEKLASQLGMSTQEAAAFKQTWTNNYPGIRLFNQATTSEAFRNKKTHGIPFVRSDLTNRRYIVPEGKEYALVNRRLQGAAAEIFKMKILQLEAMDIGQYMILFVHDEVILDVPNEDVRDVVHVLREVMNDNVMLRVPITAEISYGPRWGEKKDWTDE